MNIRFLLLWAVCWAGTSYQLPAQLANRLEQVRTYYTQGKYEMALQVIDDSRVLRLDPEAALFRALCQYQLNDLANALTNFEKLAADPKMLYPEALLYIGRIHHAQLRFDQAAQYYKSYLQSLRGDHPSRGMLVEDIRRCENGLRFQYKQSGVIVDNLGPEVNSQQDEFGPVPDPRQRSRLFYTAIKPGNTGGSINQRGQQDVRGGSYFADIFSCRQEGGTWGNPEPAIGEILTAQHETVLDFSADGNILYYQRGMQQGEGSIVADALYPSDKAAAGRLIAESGLNPSWGDQALFIFNDTLLLFASRRPGGYGGLDLYRTALRGGRWTTPENLGSTINSAFDETTPFLARDGKTLYFSTNRSSISLGGLDVVRAVYETDEGRWSAPDNMGIPVNSAADDSHFRLAKDGYTGYLASARKDGLGRRDLYVAYFSQYRSEMDMAVRSSAPQPGAEGNQPPTEVPTPARQFEPRAAADKAVIRQDPQPTAGSVAVPARPAETRAAADKAVIRQDPQPAAGSVAVPARPAETRVAAVHPESPYEWPLTDEQTAIYGPQLAQLAAQLPAGWRLIISICYPQATAAAAGFLPGLQQAQAFAKTLAAQGIDPARMSLRSLAAPAGQTAGKAVFTFCPPAGMSAAGSTLPLLGRLAGGCLQTSPHNQPLIYKVQIIASMTAASDPLLQQDPAAMAETGPGGILRYTVGAEPTFAAARARQQQLETGGYGGAYIVPYVYGERLDRGRARLLSSQFPDLQQYLQHP